MRSELEKPGFKARRNKDGSSRLYWVAPAALVRQGYTPRTVPLHYDLFDPASDALIAARCRVLQAEALAWTSGLSAEPRLFNGTVADLVRLYQRHEASPYRSLKWNSVRDVDHTLKGIEAAIGLRTLASIKAEDFPRWFEAAKRPKTEGGPERARKAQGVIKMLRRLFSFGVMVEIPEARRIREILSVMRFAMPKRRRIVLELHHVEAFIAKALEVNRLSLAIGTALQFESGMRQKDVIGEWVPVNGEKPSGIVIRGTKGKRWRRWGAGLTYADLNASGVVIKQTTKTGQGVAVDLNLLPVVLDLLAMVPTEQRIGPLIKDETHGGPYADLAYSKAWRKVARLAGIPDEVRNMDARAGAITEAENAGVSLDTIRASVGHRLASTTAGYSRGAVGKAREVALARAAHRTNVNNART